MTTPAPVASAARARRRAARSGPRPQLRMGLNGFLVAWLLPNLVTVSYTHLTLPTILLV